MEAFTEEGLLPWEFVEVSTEVNLLHKSWWELAWGDIKFHGRRFTSMEAGGLFHGST